MDSQNSQPTVSATTEDTSSQHAKSNPRMVEATVAGFANKLVTGIARHWLALFNIAWGLYVFLPFLAPIFMALGLTGPARVIYSVYSFACHQLPDHSYFFFGDLLTPHLHDLEAGGMEAGLNLFGQRRFIGNDDTGFKVAICQRDIAIYGSVLLAGLFYALTRRQARPLNWRLYILFLIPIAVDGTTQLFGLRESTWLLRSVTGALFGIASVWLAYPYVEDAMRDVLEDELVRQQPLPS